MANREAYLRIVLHVDGVEYIAGLELRPTDAFAELKTSLRARMKNTTTGLPAGRWLPIAEALERMVKKYWQDRAYFIEVGDEHTGWVQLFQPFDVPRRLAAVG